MAFLEICHAKFGPADQIWQQMFSPKEVSTCKNWFGHFTQRFFVHFYLFLFQDTPLWMEDAREQEHTKVELS